MANAGYDLVPGVDVLLSGDDQLVETLGPVEGHLQEPLGATVRASDRNGRGYVCDQVGAEGLENGREIAALIRLRGAPHELDVLLRHRLLSISQPGRLDRG